MDLETYRKSKKILVQSGVSQGSILGPLYFDIYINDLVKAIRSNILLYADDVKIFKDVSKCGDYFMLQNERLFVLFSKSAAFFFYHVTYPSLTYSTIKPLISLHQTSRMRLIKLLTLFVLFK